MEVFSLAILGAMIGKVLTVVKAFGKDWNMVLTQLVVWAAGFAIALIASHTSWAGDIVIQNIALDRLNTADLLFLGVALSSGMSVVYDYNKARDNNQSSAEPTLVPELDRPSGAS